MISTRLNPQLSHFLSTNLEEQDVQDLLSQLDALTAKVLLGGNTYVLIRQIKTLIDDASYLLTKNVLNKTNLSDSNSSLYRKLNKLLSKYTDDKTQKEKISSNVFNFIKENFESSTYPFHMYDDSIQTFIYEELEALDTKKELDETVFLFDYVSFLKEYSDLILDAQTNNEYKIVEPLMKLVSEATQPVQQLIYDQAVLTERYRKDLLSEVFNSITNFRQELMPLKEKYYRAKLSTYHPLAVINNMGIYHDKAKQFAEDQCLEIEDNVMEETINHWLNHKPNALRDNLDFNSIKSEARYCAIHNESIDEIEKEKNDLARRTNIINSDNLPANVLTGEKLTYFATLLSHFLNLAIEKNLQTFASPNTSIVLNVENRNVYMSAFLFKELLQILPEKIATAFAAKKSTDKFNVQELIDLGLGQWQRNETQIQLCQNYLSQKERFTGQLQKYLSIEEEKNLARQLKHKNADEEKEQAHVKELFTSPHANEINSNKLNSLLKCSAKPNPTAEKTFNVLLINCNKPTLEAFIQQLKLNGTTSSEKYLLAAEEQLKKITQIAQKINLFKPEQPQISPQKSIGLSRTLSC